MTPGQEEAPTGTAEAVVTVTSDFKVHPSALAAGPASTTTTTNEGPSQTMTALAAAQHAAALVSQDTVSHSAQDTQEPPAGLCLDLVSRSLPLLLTAGIAYIYYVYTFRVCVAYILRIQHRKTLAVRKPPPPVPFTTTPFQPQRTGKTVKRMVENRQAPLSDEVSDTTPLLRDSPVAAGSTKAGSYHSTFKSHAGGHDNSVRIDVGTLARSEETIVATLSISKRDGRPRWCDICRIVKPDRCHHCSECDQCVLRMDHHCPWVNGCIGYDNHKFFYLFIFYGSVLAVWVVATMIPVLFSAFRSCEHTLGLGTWEFVMSKAFSERGSPGRGDSGDCHFDFHWPLITIISLLLALMILSFTVVHTEVILQNRTTIESLQDVRSTYIRVQHRKVEHDGATVASVCSGVDGLVSSSSTVVVPNFSNVPDFNVVLVQPGEQLWDRGSWYSNWISIMGPSWWLWFVPYGNTTGDGIHDVYNEKVYQRIVGEALAQARQHSGGLLANDDHRDNLGVSYIGDDRQYQQLHQQHHQQPQQQHSYEYLHSQSLPKTSGVTAATVTATGTTTQMSTQQSIDDMFSAGDHLEPGLVHHFLDISRASPVDIDHSAEDSEASIGSMGRSLPTPHSSPRFTPFA
ncbi:palmitoyltransferase for Vac8p [Podila epigama]|nr:palmitoyltransferase for Vac8p [Podila epigama]